MRLSKKNHIRIIMLYIFVLIISFGVIAKIIKIQQFDLSINTKSQPRFFKVEAPRGNILADDGSLLAISMPLYNVYLDLSVISDKLFEDHINELSFKLSNLFNDRTPKEYEFFLRNSKNSKKNRFIRLKLKVNHNELVALKKLPILRLGQNKGGLIAEQRPHRATPFGELARRTIGEDREVNPVGVERAYDLILSGTDGVHLMRKIAQGIWIPQDSDANKMPKPGKDVVTTINIDMQDVAEKSLENTLIREDADWGCVVMMEVATGEIKVIANLKKDSLDNVSESFNYAIAEHVAPGSTFKLASVVAGLEDGYFEVTDSVDLKRGKVRYYDRIMLDSPHDFDKVTIKDAFIISSNVGISTIINENYKQNPSSFTDRIYKMGLSTSLSLELPYPDALKMPIPNEKGWSGVTLPWMSTGYEMALTPIHMLTFYNAIANRGKMMKPIFTTSIESKGIELIHRPSEVISSSICSESTINKIMPLLTGVVSQGTAKNIYSDKYKISGKTGTSVLNYANRKEGEVKMYQASFVGFFPADDPRYSCIVIINKPKNGKIYGGQIAAPVFRELADKVYALDINIHSAITSTDVMKSIPVLSQGDIDKTDLILNRLNIPNKSKSPSYMINKNFEDEVLFKDSRILEYLNNGLMPDLTGINLQDVLFVLENYGMKVIVSGIGSVIRQSIKKGDKVEKGTEIKIELA